MKIQWLTWGASHASGSRCVMGQEGVEQLQYLLWFESRDLASQGIHLEIP